MNKSSSVPVLKFGKYDNLTYNKVSKAYIIKLLGGKNFDLGRTDFSYPVWQANCSYV
jgi:hypothetical protein